MSFFLLAVIIELLLHDFYVSPNQRENKITEHLESIQTIIMQMLLNL